MYQDQTARAAIVLLNRDLTIGAVSETAANYMWVDIEGVRVYSCYFSPNILYDYFVTQLDDLDDSIRTARTEILVAGDFNSKSPEWGSGQLDRRGEVLSEMIARIDLAVLNEGNAYTFRRGNTGSVIDVTLASARTARSVTKWKLAGRPHSQ